jgi:hypothetical protein
MDIGATGVTPLRTDIVTTGQPTSIARIMRHATPMLVGTVHGCGVGVGGVAVLGAGVDGAVGSHDLVARRLNHHAADSDGVSPALLANQLGSKAVSRRSSWP